MSRGNKSIRVSEIGSVLPGMKTGKITVRGTITDGPAGTIGRAAEFELDSHGLGFIFAVLAGIPQYRLIFRAVADEISVRQLALADSATSPATKRQMQLDSLQTMQAIGLVTRNAVEQAIEQGMTLDGKPKDEPTI